MSAANSVPQEQDIVECRKCVGRALGGLGALHIGPDMNSRSKINERFRRDEILRRAEWNGRFDPERGQAALARRMMRDGLLSPMAGCSEAYRITEAGRAALAAKDS